MSRLPEDIKPQFRSFLSFVLWGSLLAGFWNHSSQELLLSLGTSSFAFALVSFLAAFALLIGFVSQKKSGLNFIPSGFSPVIRILVILLLISVPFSYLKGLANWIPSLLSLFSGFFLGRLLSCLLEETDTSNLLRRALSGIAIGFLFSLLSLYFVQSYCTGLVFLVLVFFFSFLFIGVEAGRRSHWPILLSLSLLLLFFSHDSFRSRMLTGGEKARQFRTGLGVISVSEHGGNLSLRLGNSPLKDSRFAESLLALVDELSETALNKPRILVDLRTFLLLQDGLGRLSPQSVSIIRSSTMDLRLLSWMASRLPYRIQSEPWGAFPGGKKNSGKYDLIILLDASPSSRVRPFMTKQSLSDWKKILVSKGLLAVLAQEDAVENPEAIRGVFRNNSVRRFDGYVLYRFSDFVLVDSEDGNHVSAVGPSRSAEGGLLFRSFSAWAAFLEFMRWEKNMWIIILSAGLAGMLFLSSFRFPLQTQVFSSTALSIIWISFCVAGFSDASGDSYPYLFLLLAFALSGFLPGVLVRRRLVRHLDALIILTVSLLLLMPMENFPFILFATALMMFGLGIRFAHANRLISVSPTGHQLGNSSIRAVLSSSVLFLVLMGLLVIPLFPPSARSLFFLLIFFASLPAVRVGRMGRRSSA
jgi:hypothetical protein